MRLGRIMSNLRLWATITVCALACLCTACARGQSLPADWPLRQDVLPQDAKISLGFSSQEYSAIPGASQPVELPDLPPDQAAKLEQMRTNSWSITFSTKLTPDACREHLEQVLKEEGYRYADDDAAGSQYIEEKEIRWYYSPDGKYTLSLSYISVRKAFMLMVVEQVHPDTKSYDSAKPLE